MRQRDELGRRRATARRLVVGLSRSRRASASPAAPSAGVGGNRLATVRQLAAVRRVAASAAGSNSSGSPSSLCQLPAATCAWRLVGRPVSDSQTADRPPARRRYARPCPRTRPKARRPVPDPGRLFGIQLAAVQSLAETAASIARLRCSSRWAARARQTSGCPIRRPDRFQCRVSIVAGCWASSNRALFDRPPVAASCQAGRNSSSQRNQVSATSSGSARYRCQKLVAASPVRLRPLDPQATPALRRVGELHCYSG